MKKMNKLKHIRKKSIGILIVLLFLISIITPFIDLSEIKTRKVSDEEEQSLNLSTNYLFKGTTYVFNLDDFYDDENLYKIYTGAKFQTEAFNGTSLEWSGTINNDTVLPVDNDETQYGDPSNINMINGTTDSADNMKVNDDSSTNFTSTHTDGYLYETPSQWDNFTFTEGTGDTIGDLEIINGNYSEIDCFFESSDTYGIMRPVGDIATGSWSKDGFTYFYENVDDNVEEPDVGDGSTIYTSTDGDSIYFDLTNIGYIIKSYILWVRHRCSGGTEAVDLYMDYNDGGGYGYIGQEGTTTIYEWDLRSVSSVNKLGNGWNLRIRAASPSPYTHFIDAVYLKVLYEGIDSSLDVQVDMQVDDPECSSIEYLKYSHKTNISVIMDIDIWNWDTSTWYEIESIDNSATFDDDSFTLGIDSDYVNSSFGVRIRFQATSPSSDFALLIDRFRLDYLTTPAELEMTITFTFAQYNEDLLAMTIQSWQRTNISQTINFSIWNFDTGDYVQISSSSDTSFTEKEYNTTSPTDFISSSGVVKLYWVGSNTTNDFELHIDYLFVQIFYKLDLVHEKSFDTNGIYRYRWAVLGSIHYTQWVVFEVVDPEPNFHAISESESTTRWILQNATLISFEDFHDDINTDEWQLLEVSNKTFDYTTVITRDSYVDNIYPEANFGSSIELAVGYLSDYIDWHILRAYFGFNNFDENYFFENQTGTNEIWFRIKTQFGTGNYSLYNTTAFEEYDITWSNAPSFNSLKDTGTMPGTGWKYFTVSELEEYYMIKHQTENYNEWIFVNSKESAYKPYAIRKNVSKNYFGNGYMYMQTDTTEAIALQSTDYGTYYTLSSGDYFEVDFQTNSDSQINLDLLKDGVVNKTIILSQSGNTNFNRHTAKISVDETVEFDQLKISSTFEDTDYVKCWDIKTYKYTPTGDSADFYVGSKRTESVYLTPDTYNLRILEGGDEKIDTNITIGSSDYYYVYTPIHTQYCRLVLFSIADPLSSLPFTDYHVKVNRSLNGEYNQFSLLDNIFYADEESYVYIDVYDRFDSLIGSFERLASDYIDLEIEVYLLQIKNLQTQKTTVDINSTHVYPLLSGDSLYFMLSKNYYQIGYYDTNDVYKQFLIYLNSNQAYELNRSKICFLAYVNQKGEHLYFENYKTYLNGTLLYENVFYKEIGDKIGIEVKDIYGISIKNQTYTVVSGDNYIPVVLTLYSLKVMSQQLCFNHINITRDPNYYESEYYWSEWIAPSEIIEFNLFAGYYKINLTNNEAESSSYYSYTLNGDDILLISSDNTIYNVLVNIANVNATIGNQITNVQIDLTNQNSNINNTIINIEINLDNINSTLGTLLLDIDTAISNINSSIITEIVSLGTTINNINSSITNEILTVSTAITNVNSSVISQLLTLGVDISNINGSIVNQIIDLGVDVSNINTSLSNQILSIGVDISNLDTSITNQILSVVANIENVNASIIDQTLVILSDISNTNSTLLNQMVVLGVDITNINASITNQILSLSVDLTNINSSISNLLTNINISISNLENDIGAFYAFTDTSFINLNNVMNTSFINIENNIYSINQTISNLVIGVGNDIYLINGTISTMITQLETNLLLMSVSIDTALFDLGTTMSLIGSNITSNYILLNNSIYLNNLNINDSRIAIINNLLLINNTISTLISEVYSAVYLINNSIYTAVVDLGAYLSLMNNTIYGNLSIVLEMNEFLTEIYKMTMFSDLLNWTNVGLNISLLTSQIDAWTFLNYYINQSIVVHLRYQDLIEELIISADDSIEQYLPYDGVEYREWSEELQEYVGEWKELDPDDKTVDFGFYDEEVPDIPSFDNTSITIVLIILIFIGVIGLSSYFVYKYNKRVQNLKLAYARQHTVDKDLIEGVAGRSSRMKRIK